MVKPQDQTIAPGAAPRAGTVSVVVDKVSKRYGKIKQTTASTGRDVGRTWALKDISLRVERGQMLGLLGPNGAGKTTLMKCIATLLEPSSGRILVEGIDVAREPLNARKAMGLVTCDERSFYWRLSARENLKFFGALYRVPARQLDGRIATLLDALGLTSAADRPYHSFSTGMRQKMAIARGLLNDPQVVLYDEPTRSLDPVSTQRIREWVRESREMHPDRTHIIATNQLTEAEQLCDRVLIVNGGQIVAEGTVREIRERFGKAEQMIHRLVCTGLAAQQLPRADPRAGVWDISPEEGEAGTMIVRAATDAAGSGLSRVLEAVLAAGGRILSCETERASFDEVFCRIIENESTRESKVEGVLS